MSCALKSWVVRRLSWPAPRGRLAHLALVLVAACAPAVHAQSPDDGVMASIEGAVSITRSLSAQRMRFRVYPGVRHQPPPEDTGHRTDEWANVVIYLETDQALPAIEVPAERPAMIQQGETFIPHVLPVRVGATVDFPNRDPIFHNVFSLSRVSAFDLGRYPEGESRSVTFDHPGVVPVFCHLHSDMSAIVLVLENHLFSQPDTQGNYRLKPVPAGDYTLVAWHPRAEAVRLPVTVAAGEVLKLDLTVPIVDEEATE